MKDRKNKPKEKKEKYSVRRLLSNIGFVWKMYYQAFKPIIVVGPLLEILYACSTFFSDTYFLYKVVDLWEAGKDLSTIIWFAVIAYAVSFAMNSLYNWFYSVPWVKINLKMSQARDQLIFGKAASLDLACYETPSVYEKMSRAMEVATESIYNTFFNVDNLVWRFFELGMTSFLVLLIDPVLILFAVIPLFLGLLKNWENNLTNERDKEFRKSWRKADYVRRIFYQTEYAKELRLGKMSLLMVNHLRAAYVAFKRTVHQYGWKLAFIGWLRTVGREVVTILGAMAYSVWRVSRGEMAVASCIVVINSIGVVAGSLSDLVATMGTVGKNAREIGDFRAFLDLEPKIVDDPELPVALAGDVVFDHVTFRYDGAEKDTLKDINLRIRAGEHIALVGQNGSGKSTLVKLLLRLYDPTEGTVSVSGQDARECRLSSYRSLFGCVFQDYKVLAATVRENVLMGEHPENEDEIVTEALKKSGAWQKISSFEKGIDTVLTREFDDHGENLSGGEAQKVALARVFAIKRPFVILDEPSSALDPIAEHQMFENMMAAAEGSTVLFISHRLSTAVNADRIFMMENGSIIETGTHEELMALDGKYAAMFKVQAANYNGQTELQEEVTGA